MVLVGTKVVDSSGLIVGLWTWIKLGFVFETVLARAFLTTTWFSYVSTPMPLLSANKYHK